MCKKPTTFQWYVTTPNPRSPCTGPDAGQRGWRLHAVPLKRGEDFDAWKRRPALCGAWPRHGWGVDLFVEDECARCQKALTKREAAGETFVDLAEVFEQERQRIEAQLNQAYRANPDMSDDDFEAMRNRLRQEAHDAAMAAA